MREAVQGTGAETSDFDLHPDLALPQGRKLRAAAVLVAVDFSRADCPRLILTKRSSKLRHHPGQVAFPGGKVDEGDVDLIDTAFREAHEEIGLPRAGAEIFGTLPPHETVTGFSVTPVLACLDAPFDPVIDRGEVDEMFYVPLAHVLSPDRFAVQGRRWRGTMRRYYTVPYGPYYIWGATARMLFALAQRVAA